MVRGIELSLWVEASEERGAWGSRGVRGLGCLVGVDVFGVGG
jgi:hypothetical protein